MSTAPLPNPAPDAESLTPKPLALATTATKGPTEVPRPERVYVNRNLRVDQIGVVGFDMDYTLALYDQPKIEELSVRATVDKLIASKGYPEAIRAMPYDATLAIRGLVVDMQEGNVFKPDRYGSPGRVVHGRRILDETRVREQYLRDRMRLSNPRYAWIDTLFALPEAVLYIDLVDFFDAITGPKPSYTQLWRDIRECIDLAHRDGSIKTIVAAEMPTYIQRDEELAETLHRFRSSGKRLFLLTNSAWDYTNPVMTFLLDGAISAYPSWRQYFDVIIVSAAKPAFFTEEHPFIEVDPVSGALLDRMGDGPFVRGRVYSGGNVRDFEARAGARGSEVLYIGDHIYGDMLRSRKSSAWRTAMILQEMEHEISVHDRVARRLDELDGLERQLRHLDADISDKQMVLRSLQKLESVTGAAAVERSELKRQVKESLDKLREELRRGAADHALAETELDAAFNPHWGPLFREGHEISKFGEQVEAYACVYTGRVSNFRHYSPNRHFRGPRDRMPHER